MMDRRAFLGSLGLAGLTVPRIAPAQPTRRVSRVGILGSAKSSEMIGPHPQSPTADAFLRGMRDLGYVYGEHFVTEPRGSAGRPERLPALARELVHLQVDVIVAPGYAIPPVQQATATLPVVMAASSDPVGLGFVQSLGHPGGNVTGLSLQSIDTTAKRLELLKELVPGEAPVAVIWDRPNLAYWQAAETAARERGWKLLSLEIRGADEIEQAFKAATDGHASALLVFAPGILFPHARRVAELASRSRLPAMYELRPYVEAGGLISYGADLIAIWRRAAGFVDKILKGAKPADLPVEQPTKFELVINLKTAKALGLTIPQSVLIRADEVIQ